MTLSELKTLIQNYVENSETTFVNTLDDFIKNAEERIFELIQFDFFRKQTKGYANKWVNGPIQNPKAKQWIKDQLRLKKAGLRK